MNTGARSWTTPRLALWGWWGRIYTWQNLHLYIGRHESHRSSRASLGLCPLTVVIERMSTIVFAYGYKVADSGREGDIVMGCGEGMVVGLYSLSYVVTWYMGVLNSTWISFSLPLLCATSISAFLLKWEFSYLKASISSALHFLNSTNSCCILACPLRMAVRLI